MFLEDTLAERLNLAERHRAETARALKAQIKAADTSEQGKDAQHQRCPAIVAVGFA